MEFKKKIILQEELGVLRVPFNANNEYGQYKPEHHHTGKHFIYNMQNHQVHLKVYCAALCKIKGVQKRMSNFEFSLYINQFSSHRFSSNITGFHFSIQIQRYPLLFSTIIGSKVMKANVRIAGNSACQDFFTEIETTSAIIKLL